MTEEEIEEYLNGPVQPDPSIFLDRVSSRHGLTVNVPANLPEIAVDNEVSFQSGMPSDYMYGSARFDGDDDFLDGFGLTGGVGNPKDFVKGVAKSAGDLTAGFLGQTLFQLGESIEEGEGVQDRFRALVEGDIKSLLTMAINPVESISTLLEDVGKVTGTKQAMAQRFQILGQRLIDRNDAWIAKHGLAFTDAGEPTLLHAIGSGTTSLAGALGLAFVTKSPTATALLFGQIQGSDTYIEAREQGLDINDSQFYSGISLVTEAALEKFGLDIILRGTGGGFYKNVAKGFLTEGTQEAMQTSAEMAIEEMGGFSNLTSEQKIQGIKQAALIGALLGGPAGGVFGGGVPKQTLEDILVRELEDMDITEVSLQNDIDSGRPTIKLTSQMSKDQREIIEKLNKFLAGEEIEWDTKDSRDRAVMRAVRSIKNSRIQAGQELIAGQGRLLQERRSGIVSKLRDIERRGEDLVKRLLEKFPEEERSIETQQKVEEIVDMIAEIEQSGGNAINTLFAPPIPTIDQQLSDTLDKVFAESLPQKVEPLPEEVEGFTEIPEGFSFIHGTTKPQYESILESGKLLSSAEKVSGGTTDEAGLIWVFAETEMQAAELYASGSEQRGEVEKGGVVRVVAPYDMKIINRDNPLTKEEAEKLNRLNKRTYDPIEAGTTFNQAMNIFAQHDRTEANKDVPRTISEALAILGYDGIRYAGNQIGLSVSELQIKTEPTQTTAQEDVTPRPTAQPADNALMDLIDEYGYSEMMDDIRQDAEFRDVIETDEGFIRIQGQAEGLREQLAAIDRQIDEIRELDPEGEVFEATGRQLQLRDDIFRKLNMLAEDTLDIGVEAGKKQARKGADFFSSQFNKAIDSLPVSDKAKNRFRRRLRYIDDRPETFQRQMDKLAADAIVQVDREMRKSAKEKVKSALSKGVKAKVHADIKDSLIRMKKMKKGKLKKFTAETSNDGLIDLMTDMEVRYARLLQDKSASTLEWQLFGEDLAQIIKTGKTVWQQYQERITGRQKDMINEVVSSKAKSGPVVSRLNRITGAAGMNTIVWTFDTIIDMAGLRNTVFGRWIKADMAFRSNRNAFNDKIKRLVAETMPNGYRSNLKEITIKSGSGVKQTLTYGQAIQLWMYSRSREVRQSMMDGDGMAYTEDNFNEIESFIGKQGTDFAQGLFDIYEESGIRMNDEHRKVFGVSLNLRENYSPVAREGAEGQDVLAVGYNSPQLFHEPSSFKKFTNSKNNIIIDDALQVAYRHMNSTEWWLAYHNVYRDSKALLKNKDVREKIIQRMGENNLKALENHVSKMEHYSGEWNIMSGGTIDKFRRNFTKSVLGANPQIGIKQLSSALASLSTVPAADYAKAQAEFWNPVMMPKILKKLSEHESSRRGKNFDPEIAEMLIENPGKWLGKKGMTRFIDFSLMPVRMGDMLGFSASVYAEYRYLKKIGVPDKQALNRAMENGERSQQSVLPSQMTILQKEGHPLVRLITMFTSSPVALMNMEMKAVQAYRDGRIDKRDMMRRIAIYHSFIPMLFGFIATAFDTEPEEVVYNGMFGSWGSTPLYGSSLTHIGGMITGSDVFQKEELAPDLIFETTRENTKALNMVWRDFIKDDESFTMEEYYQAITDAITSDIEILTGMPASNIVDMLEGIKGLVGEDDKWDFFLKSLGFSDYIIEKDSDGGATVNFTI